MGGKRGSLPSKNPISLFSRTPWTKTARLGFSEAIFARKPRSHPAPFFLTWGFLHSYSRYRPIAHAQKPILAIFDHGVDENCKNGFSSVPVCDFCAPERDLAASGSKRRTAMGFVHRSMRRQERTARIRLLGYARSFRTPRHKKARQHPWRALRNRLLGSVS